MSEHYPHVCCGSCRACERGDRYCATCGYPFPCEVATLTETLARIQALHTITRRRWSSEQPDLVQEYCACDGELWPCVTIQALETVQPCSESRNMNEAGSVDAGGVE